MSQDTTAEESVRSVVYWGGDFMSEEGRGNQAHAFPKVLRDVLDMPIKTLSVEQDGIFSSQDYLRDIKNLNPQLVIIAFGGENTILESISNEESLEDFGVLISEIKNNGSEILVLDLRTFKQAYPSHLVLRDFFLERNVVYMSTIFNDLLLGPDNINNAGNVTYKAKRLIAERMSPIIQALVTY